MRGGVGKVEVSWVQTDSDFIDVADLISKHRDEYFALDTEPEWERPSELMNRLLHKGDLGFVPYEAEDVDWDWSESDYDNLVAAHPWIAPPEDGGDPEWAPVPQCVGQEPLFGGAS